MTAPEERKRRERGAGDLGKTQIRRAHRRLPRWSELRPLLQVEPPRWRHRARAALAGDILDMRRLAARRAPRAVFDYVDGAAEGETSLRRARRAFRDTELRPRVLRDVTAVDAGTTILGRSSALPLVLAPTGFTRMMHAEGERAVVAAAEDAGVPYALSTMGTTSIEDVAEAAPRARRWFQLYVWRDRDAAGQLVDRARAAGYEALVLTVDTPVAGARLRDVRNGLTIPPRLTPRTLADGVLHPAWWWDLLTTEPLEFATLSRFGGTVADLADRLFDPGVTFGDLAWLRSRWDGPLVIKGIQTVEDARIALDHGAEAIVVSNHGGRQLDRAPTPLLELPAIAEAVGGRAEVYLDGGVLSGGDVAVAVAAGARAVLVGRAYLYGLMAGGRAGVDRALEVLASEYRRTLQLLGVACTADLGSAHVRLPGR